MIDESPQRPIEKPLAPHSVRASALQANVTMSVTRQIKVWASELDFDFIGIAPAVTPRGITHLSGWLERGFAGEMHYMERQAQAREHPRHVLDGVRSIIVVALNYRTADPAPPGPFEGRVSRYAWGEDYHRILRERINQLGNFLHDELPECRTRAVVDTAPLLERDFARLAGIGWIGKNTMLINKRLGSWLFLGALLTDVELEYDQPHAADHCGTCTRCLDACPTDAFVAPHQLDSRRCISYLTIELRGPIPKELRPGIGNWLFGCDICQEVCPWNRKAPATNVAEFEPRHDGGNVNLLKLLEMNDESIRERIAGTALTRAGVPGLRRNAAVLLGNAGNSASLPVLRRLAQHDDATVCEAANWAISELQS
jgi:epoxyqueuosine reductase